VTAPAVDPIEVRQAIRPADPDERKALVLRSAVIVMISAGIGWWGRNLHWGVVWQSRWLLLNGLAATAAYSIVCLALGLILGIALAAARAYGHAIVRLPATMLIEIVRGLPQLMVIFWVFFAIPELTKSAPNGAVSAVIALSAIAAAYLAEDVRAGFTSLHNVQWESGYSTGLSRFQIFRHIMIPQATRNMLPAIIVTGITMIKVTTLVYVVGVVDYFRATMLINNRVFAPFELYLTAAVVYFLLCSSLSYLVRKVDPKYTLVG